MLKISGIMHPRIAVLAKELFALIENAPAAPTAWDRDRLMAVRYKIKGLPEENGIKLSDSEETDRQYLYVEATLLANRQEAFYEGDDHKWALRPYKDMADDEAQAAINTCIRRKLRSGTVIADIHAALENEVGVTDVALSVSPKPVDGRLPDVGGGRFQFQFMAIAPSGATIR